MSRRGLRIEIEGSVQGVGFRPFVYNLARELGVSGWIVNDVQGVCIEAEGEPATVERFVERLRGEVPPAASIEAMRIETIDAAGSAVFEIRPSDSGGAKTAQLLPEIATCSACLGELFDPGDRRQRYPFLNCTQCGPRFSILLSLPYDRPRTTMGGFELCADCRAEYEDPTDRRFHAQPNACPVCGPRLALWSPGGETLAREDPALRGAAQALSRGEVVALKGLGGFLLMADAGAGETLRRLRVAKARPDKPFALMVRDLEQARELCHVEAGEAALLTSAAAPIVLLRRREGAALAEEVAPANPWVGLMLPYAPLHHLLLREFGSPLVATSGNRADEPICTDEIEALQRLAGIADLFLVHDRPIARHVDDSVAWCVEGAPRVLRRARGYAPRPLLIERELPTILAVGGHLKNAVALALGRRVLVSQHIGDMETAQAMEAFERVIDDFLSIYEVRPVALAHDLHPDYAPTAWALREAGSARGIGAVSERPLAGVPLVPVQHHHAHLVSCLMDNDCDGSALGVVWDGAGYGPDGTIWGGEFLLGDAAGFRRVAHLRPFRLPGGDAAAREPRRSALALLWELSGEAALDLGELPSLRAFSGAESRLLRSMLLRDVSCPLTTSAGRLFDAVASLTGLAQRSSFEGHGAMLLEFAADPGEGGAYPFELHAPGGGAPLVIDWEPALRALLEDLGQGATVAVVAARFHHGLVEAVVEVATEVGEPRVALSGGCFQNRLLLTRGAARLREAGFEPLLHRRVPPNDGGICLGQVGVAAALL